MKMWRIFLLWLIPTAAFADIDPDVTHTDLISFEAGVICAPPTISMAPAPDTVAGTIHLIDDEPDFVSVKRRVPAVLGIGFGTKAQSAYIAGEPNVTVTITHPPIGDTGAMRQSFDSRISGTKPSLPFYQFDFDYELVTGIGQVEARSGDKIIYRTTFEVVDPAQTPDLAAICGCTDLLS